ncbi:hypothetical protein HMPREF3293_01507 [Christensenella minuta]|uniref:Uncharacterized protein n=1 Tax=Christensenella minuta TaxID=626937 RepID=A0A136Q4I3_9FIRM|nr:hypothetical protein HMPREF3293_01507 [Christensenella minuta]
MRKEEQPPERGAASSRPLRAYAIPRKRTGPVHIEKKYKKEYQFITKRGSLLCWI